MTFRRWWKAGSFTMFIVLAAGASNSTIAAMPEALPLHGIVRSDTGQPLVGIPVLAHPAGSNMTLAAYTNKDGKYGFQNLPDGTTAITVSIDVAGFAEVQKPSVITGKKSSEVDFSLNAIPPVPKKMTDSEILAGLTGSVEEKRAFFINGETECYQCHFFDRLIKNQGLDKAGWLGILELMRRQNRIGRVDPTKAELDQRVARGHAFDDRMADYMATALGPNSHPTFQYAERPTSEASTHLTATIYQTPRGADPAGDIPTGQGRYPGLTVWTIANVDWFARKYRAANRGDSTFSWLHDVQPDPAAGYVYYSDQFSTILGQIDMKTGEAKEFPAPMVNPERSPGTQGMSVDKDGNLWLSLTWQGGIARFSPKEQKFTGSFDVEFKGGSGGACGFNTVASDGTPWCRSSGDDGSLSHLDLTTKKFTTYTIPKTMSPKPGFYGIVIDSLNRVYACEFGGEGGIARFDPETNQFKHWPVPTKNSGPRRPSMDSQDRLWFPEFYSGKLGVFDPKTEQMKEWTMPNDPYAAPYVTAVDKKNNKVWISDFEGDFIYVFDMKTEKFTQYLLPFHDLRIRHLMVDETTTPSTVWAAVFTPQGRVLKFQAW